MIESRNRSDSKSVASSTTATTQSTMSSTKSGKSKSSSKSSTTEGPSKSKSDKPRKEKGEGKPVKSKKPSSSSSKTTENGEKPRRKKGDPKARAKSANFDFAADFDFEAAAAFMSIEGAVPTPGERPPPPRQRLRARRRASVTAGSAPPVASTAAFSSGSEDESGFSADPTTPDSRRAPRSSRSADGLDMGAAVAARQPRRRARRASAIGGLSSRSFSGDLTGMETNSSGPSAIDQFGYGTASSSDLNFGYGDSGFDGNSSKDFSFDGNASRDLSYGYDGNQSKSAFSYEGEAEQDGAAANRQRKLMDDITFGTDFDSAPKTGTSSASNFIAPMAEGGPAAGGGGGNRRAPRRRASLTFGSSFVNNHQTLAPDKDDANKKSNKTGFFKDRSADKKGARPSVTREKSTEKLTGYDFDRDRRRFMG